MHSADYIKHFNKAAGTNSVSDSINGEVTNIEHMVSYPPFASWVFSVFSFKLEYYWFAVLLFFFLLPALLLMFFTREWVAGLFWLSFSAAWVFVWGMIGQAMATVFFIPFVFVKNKWFRVLLLFGSLLMQSHAFWLFGFYWVFEVLWFKKKDLVSFGVCSFGVPKTVEGATIVDTVGKVETGTNVLGSKGLAYTSYSDFFVGLVLILFWFLGCLVCGKSLGECLCFVFFGFCSVLFFLFRVFWRVLLRFLLLVWLLIINVFLRR